MATTLPFTVTRTMTAFKCCLVMAVRTSDAMPSACLESGADEDPVDAFGAGDAVQEVSPAAVTSATTIAVPIQVMRE
ncbi:hypothetical protein GCM10027415_28530 [Humibacter ginsengisoli]